MLLADLIADLGIDTGGDVGFFTAKRCFERAAAQVNSDLGTAYEVAGSDAGTATLLPDPTARDRELLLILAMRHLVGMGRVAATDAFSFKSGDKSVDRSRTALSKEEAVRDLWKDYLALAGIGPDQAKLVGAASAESTGGDIDWSANRNWLS